MTFSKRNESAAKKKKYSKEKANNDKTTISASRTGCRRCTKCGVSSKKEHNLSFLRITKILNKQKETAMFKTHKNCAAGKFLHEEMMRRIGRSNKLQKDERICSNCKVRSLRETISIKYKGEKFSQRFEFKVCAAEELESKVNSLPKKLCPRLINA